MPGGDEQRITDADRLHVGASSASQAILATASIDEPAPSGVGPASSPSFSPSSSSYVYPVRSLLSGIQLARNEQPAVPGILGAIGALPTALSMSQPAAQLKREKEFRDNAERRAKSSLPEGKDPSSKDASERPFVPLNSEGYLSQFVGSSSRQKAPPLQGEPAPVEGKDQSFAGKRAGPALPEANSEEGEQRVRILSGDRDADEYDPRHPEPISSAGADVIATAYTTPSLRMPKAMQAAAGDDPSHSKPIDFSQSGIVHLPPIPSHSSSERGSSVSGGSLVSSRKPRDNIQSPLSGSGSDPWGRSDRGKGSAGEGTQSGGLSGTDSTGDAVGGTPSSTNLSSSSDLVTFRFEHVVDENGFHVLTGREGDLTKCEDEPIHAPGAVQGFGVLIAVEEDDNTGDLVVRQVSENSTELLGLSPRYLFGLECFTQTLPDSQADLLWDNVQFLNDSEFSEGEQESNDNPQVFLLSGWGEPGSAPPDEDEELEREGDRRFWTCWCAAHRPPSRVQAHKAKGGGSTRPFERSLIILEFELERDLYNPLYPPFQSDVIPSGSPDSQASSRSSHVSSGSTTATTFSRGSGSTTEMYASPGPTVGNTPPTSSDASQSSSDVTAAMLNPAELFLAQQGHEGDDQWFPRPEDVFESTTSHAKPLKALERMRRISRTFSSPGPDPSSFGSFETPQTRKQQARVRRGAQTGVGTMDIFAVLAQVNDQLSSAPDLDSFLKVVVGVIKDLTQFHRVLVYQFDEQYNGQVVAELVDWRQTHDLFKGLHFPESDIPAQARELYKIDKVRLLYNRSQTVARFVVRSREDLETPLDLTHSFLRAMSPIHIKYLANMGVRSSMSISIVTFGALWGLISCHSYGSQGMRVSFPVRQMLRLLSDSVSRNIERLSYAQRLLTRKLISTLPTDSHPTGYIVSNAEDLLGLFDADFGVLVIGDGAKILGPNQHSQEILLVAEYLRLKQFTLMQVSQSVVKDFPDLQLPSGLEIIAGLLCVPLSRGGKDFIAFLRKGQLRDVHWAGKPYKDDIESILEPRKSFKTWSETVAGRCRVWTEEEMETAGVLALVYGKFIEVWRQKESALQTTQLTNILLSNASHEVRTPLNHIINYLEMALNGPLDGETRENLSRSHSASKSLLFTINDLLDLTRLESGNETYFNEPFNLHEAIADAIQLYRDEAYRRNVQFELDMSGCPQMVVGDAKKIRTVVANLSANAVKFTTEGKVTVSCHKFEEPRGLRDSKEVAIEIVVGDTGCGIETSKLESIFRDFEQVESSVSSSSDHLPGLGLGLAVVARIVEQLGGQLRVDSKPNEGSRFSFLIPFELPAVVQQSRISPTRSNSSVQSLRSRRSSDSSGIDGLVEALQSDHMKRPKVVTATRRRQQQYNPNIPPKEGTFNVSDSRFPIKSLKVDDFDVDKSVELSQIKTMAPTPVPPHLSPSSATRSPSRGSPIQSTPNGKLRVLVVDDDHINRTILTKRLTLDGHTVVGTRDGQEGVEAIKADSDFDCILMDIQMPILNGFDAAKAIRDLPTESSSSPVSPGKKQPRKSKDLNGGRIPIFAVSASLPEGQRDEMLSYGMDGWILKPIEFNQLRKILSGIFNPEQRRSAVYKPGSNWEDGGWFEGGKTSL